MRAAQSAALTCRVVAMALLASAVLTSVLLIGLPRLGHGIVVITGGSMSPTIPRGSLVALDPLDGQRAQPNDVVTFKADNGVLVTHRVTRVVLHDGERYVETRGDANAQPDPALVPESRILGRVWRFVPAGGYVVATMSRPLGWLTLAAVLVMLWSLSALLAELGARPVLRVPGPMAGYVPSPWAP